MADSKKTDKDEKTGAPKNPHPNSGKAETGPFPWAMGEYLDGKSVRRQGWQDGRVMDPKHPQPSMTFRQEDLRAVDWVTI